MIVIGEYFIGLRTSSTHCELVWVQGKRPIAEKSSIAENLRIQVWISHCTYVVAYILRSVIIVATTIEGSGA